MEIRARFETFIANNLDTKAEVDANSLARDFYTQEERLLRKLAAYSLMNMLVKWADDILAQSFDRQSARNSQYQLMLPLSLQGIEVPGALSFLSGANKVKWVANYKAVGWQVEAHLFLLRKHDDEVHAARLEFERLWEAVKPYMEVDEKMQLPKALKLASQYENPHWVPAIVAKPLGEPV
jgi:hypothetical protein